MFKILKILKGLLLSILLSCNSPGHLSQSGIVMPATSSLVTSPEASPPPPAYDPLQIKYAKKLHVQPGKIQNLRLYRFMEKWMNTPYKWGGDDDQGIDCSAFIRQLLLEVYAINISRTSVEQFLNEHVERFGSRQFLSEGDIVFFRTRTNTLISHVGLFLHNNLFLNSSSSQGVSIASLDNPYWKKCYVAAGRLR